jgi:predicted nucleotidyltransferase
MQFPPEVIRLVDEQPYPLVFASISGAHLYGFPSPDSDFDVRGVHVLPIRDVVGLNVGRESIDVGGVRGGLEMDLVTHDVRKYFALILKRDGNVLEQLHSPLVVRTSPEHEELKQIARGCVTKHHVHHYAGFANTQWRLFEKATPRRVKPLLYVYRVLLTGIHLMRTGEVDANLITLNERYPLPYVPGLVARKLSGAEKSTLDDADFEFHRGEFSRLLEELNRASERSHLPENPTSKPALNDLLLRLRGVARQPEEI